MTDSIFSSSIQFPERIRARDIQMSAVAFLETRTLFVSGTLETSDRAVMVTYDLPAEGQWNIIKTETNLSDTVWRSWIMSVDADGQFLDLPHAPNRSMQFAKSMISKDQKRLGFYDGEVRPGESVLKQFTIESPSRRFYMAHGRRATIFDSTNETEIFDEVQNGYQLDPAYEISVPVAVRF